jgi:hypothetical protein
MTKHIELSAQETFAMGCKWDKQRGQKQSSILNAMGGIFATVVTISGVDKIGSTVSGLKSYKCCNCGMVAIRKANGDIDSIEYEPTN